MKKMKGIMSLNLETLRLSNRILKRRTLKILKQEKRIKNLKKIKKIKKILYLTSPLIK